jgi:hypothetical protein
MSINYNRCLAGVCLFQAKTGRTPRLIIVPQTFIDTLINEIELGCGESLQRKEDGWYLWDEVKLVPLGASLEAYKGWSSIKLEEGAE